MIRFVARRWNRETQEAFRAISRFLLIFVALAYTFIFVANWRVYEKGEPGGFAAFFSALLIAHTHGIAAVYDPSLQNTFHPGIASNHSYWYHLSYELLLLWPLGYVPRAWAFIVWTSLNIASIVGGILLISEHIQLKKWELLLYALAFAPVWIMCVNGQDSGILFLCFAFALNRWMKGKEFSAGMAIALSLFKFQYAILAIAILGWTYRRMLAGFVATSAALLGISFWLVGVQGVRGFLEMLPSDRYEVGLMMANVRGLVFAAYGKDVFWITALVSGLLYAFTVWLIATRRDHALCFALALLAAWLLGYHGHFYDAVLLLIPLAIALKYVNWPIVLIVISPVLSVRPFEIFWLAVPVLYLFCQLGRIPARAPRTAYA